MKKAICILSALLTVIFASLSFTAAEAAAPDSLKLVTIAANEAIADSTQAVRRNASQATFDFESIRSYLVEELSACHATILLNQFDIPVDQVGALADFIRDKMPDMFHVDGMINVMGTDKYIYSVEMRYLLNAGQFKSCCAQMETNIAYLMRDLDTNALSDMQKALLLHDRVAIWCQYYTVSGKTEMFKDARHTIAGVFLDQSASCTGYSRAYKFMLDRLGIDSYITTSPSLNHSWNIVKIGGKYYHVDITWDDKTPDMYGKVYHENFLRSTKGIKSTEHNVADFDTTPTSTTYDNYYWVDSFSEFQYVNGTIYYIDNIDGMIRKRVNGKDVDLCAVKGDWHGWETTTATGLKYSCYSCLSSDEYYVYFNSGDKIYKIDPKTEDVSVVYTPKLTNERRIFGFKAYNKVFYLQTKFSPADNSTPVNYTYTKDFKVTYNANGGTGAPAAGLFRQDVPLRLSTVKPTNGDRIFLGWAESSNAAQAKYQPGAVFTATKDTVLYAVWQAGALTVKFNANGGTCTTASKSVTYNSNYGTLPTPTRTGYTFAGWFTAPTGGDQITSDTKVTIINDTTLYAHWKGLQYKVTFSPNGGTCSTTAKNVSYGDAYGELPVPVLRGYAFKGWYTAANGGTKKTAADIYSEMGNTTLYAQWELATYTVSFNANGGSMMPTTLLRKYADKYGTLPTADNAGYTFKGWYTDAVGGTKINSEMTLVTAADHTVFAHWGANSYVLSFNANGGTGSAESMTVKFGTPVGILPTVEKAGCIFAGWYIGSTRIDAKSNYIFDHNETATAKWIMNPCIGIRNYQAERKVDFKTTITFTAEYDSGIPGAQVIWYGENGNVIARGNSCTVSNATRSFTVQAKLILDGETLSETEVEKVNVDTSFFAKLIAFFKGLFGTLPKVNQ